MYDVEGFSQSWYVKISKVRGTLFSPDLTVLFTRNLLANVVVGIIFSFSLFMLISFSHNNLTDIKPDPTSYP